ncbi:MAG: avidin/streptavidin family protein [Kordiimonas sp.]
MRLKNILLVGTLVASLVPTAAFSRDCSDIRGEWKTNVNAKIIFESIDGKTGQLSGTYFSVTPPSRPFPITGFVGTKIPEKEGMHNALPISFVVSFPDDGEMISWSGICRMIDGAPVLETEDHLVSASAANRWVHVAANHDTITVK